MTQNKTATRRTFLKGGALLAAPIAVTSTAAVVMADDRLAHRVAHLEDEAAIRSLHGSWLRQVNAGEHDTRLDASVSRITADHAGAADRIEVAADHQSAVGLFDYAVELETPLAQDSTLAQMAHVQGYGVTRRIERRLLTVSYTRSRGAWAIGKIALNTT
jgi:hypothetical protein